MALAEIGLPAIIRPSSRWAAAGWRPSPTIARSSSNFVERGVDARLRGEDADRGERARLEGITRWRWVRGTRAEHLHHHLHRSRNIDPMGRAHGRFDHGGAGADAQPTQANTRSYAADASSRRSARSASRPGGSNVCRSQSTRRTDRMVVIEMNPASRAPPPLASKATGLPDRQGTRRRLAVGYTLDEESATTSRCPRAPAAFGADDRLRRHKDPALRLREVPGE